MLAIDGIPDEANAVTAFYGTLELMVTELEGGHPAILVPYFSAEDLFAAGPVTIDMHVDGEACTGFDVQVRGLPSPTEEGVSGTFERFVTDASTTLDATLEESGLTLDEIRAVSETGSPLHPFLYLADYLVRGEDNPNSLERVLHEGTVVADGGVIELDMNVMDGILALAYESSQAQSSSFGLTPAQANCIPVHHCFHARTIEGLAELMDRQYQAEHVWMPATEIAVAIASGAAVLVPGLGTVFGGVALAATLYQWAIVATDVYRLPYSVDMYFDVTQTQLEEDGTGEWYGLTLYPMDKGGVNVYQALFDLTVSIPSPGATLFDDLLSTIIGRLNLPEWDAPRPYDWAAVQITPEQAPQWVSVGDGASIVVLLDGTADYEGRTTGPGAVALRLKPEKFNYQDFNWAVEVDVLAIEVTIEPEQIELHAGETACFTAIVNNAVDTSVEWKDPNGMITEGPEYCWTAPEEDLLDDICEAYGSVTHEVTATSTSRTGARQTKHSPPVRSSSATAEVACEGEASELSGYLTLELQLEYTGHAPGCCTGNAEGWARITLPVSVSSTREIQLVQGGEYRAAFDVLEDSNNFGNEPARHCYFHHFGEEDSGYAAGNQIGVGGVASLPSDHVWFRGIILATTIVNSGVNCQNEEYEYPLYEVVLSTELPPNWLADCALRCTGTYSSPPERLVEEYGRVIGAVGPLPRVHCEPAPEWSCNVSWTRTLTWDFYAE